MTRDIDLMGKKYIWFSISGIIILVSVISLLTAGLNLSIDFKSGTKLVTSFQQDVTVDQVREVINNSGYPDAVVQSIQGGRYQVTFPGLSTELITSFQQDVTVDQVREVVSNLGYPDVVIQTIEGGRFQITFSELADDEEDAVFTALDASFGVNQDDTSWISQQEDAIIGALDTSFGVNKDDTSWQRVGPTFGHQVRDSAIKAVIIAWLLIIGYVSLRFEFKFAVATIAALIHDLVITVGVYSLTGREVTTATVAAVLTILGYSLYDTIIVFDRVRENQPRARRGTYARMVNTSIMEVLNRSIITTVLVIMPVACLLIFGGETLKDFAFALMIGIVSGTYSSIFLASPLLTLWKEREKRYRPKAVAGKAAR